MSDAVLTIDESKAAYGIDVEQPRNYNSNYIILDGEKPTASLDTAEVFRKLVDEWKRETAHQSFVSQRVKHPAYLRIVGMGRSIVPLILKELERESDHWFYALVFLTGENPVPNNFTGTIVDASDLWIRWGRSRYAA